MVGKDARKACPGDGGDVVWLIVGIHLHFAKIKHPERRRFSSWLGMKNRKAGENQRKGMRFLLAGLVGLLPVLSSAFLSPASIPGGCRLSGTRQGVASSRRAGLIGGGSLGKGTASSPNLRCSATSRAAGTLADEVRDSFPNLNVKVHGDKDLVYLDSAATSHKPDVVLAAVEKFYRETNANVHRGAHELSVKATDMYEDARGKVWRRPFSNFCVSSLPLTPT